MWETVCKRRGLENLNSVVLHMSSCELLAARTSHHMLSKRDVKHLIFLALKAFNLFKAN